MLKAVSLTFYLKNAKNLAEPLYFTCSYFFMQGGKEKFLLKRKKFPENRRSRSFPPLMKI